jgi:hypothetical protein
MLKILGVILLVFGGLPIIAESSAYIIAIWSAMRGGELEWPEHALPAVAHIAYPLLVYLGAAMLFPSVVPARFQEAVGAFRRRRTDEHRGTGNG